MQEKEILKLIKAAKKNPVGRGYVIDITLGVEKELGIIPKTVSGAIEDYLDVRKNRVQKKRKNKDLAELILERCNNEVFMGAACEILRQVGEYVGPTNYPYPRVRKDYHPVG